MKRFGFLICLILILSLSVSDRAQAVRFGINAAPVRILCICSYNYSYSIVPRQLEGLEDGLGDLSYDISYEFMDSKNFYQPTDLNEFYGFLDYKIHHSEPYDILVLCDDNALLFWLNYREKLFKDLPTVFLGVNNLSDAKTAYNDGLATGIAEIPDYIANFKLMHELFPDRKRVVALMDNSISSRGEYSLFQSYYKDYEELEYSVINTMDYSKKGLMDALAKIKDDSIILYLDFLEDGDGNIYTERTASALLYDSAPHVPIFRVGSSNITNGILGGLVYAHYEAGVQAGNMVAEIATGTPMSQLLMVTKPLVSAVFDQDIMDEYHITASELPEDATIIGEHPSIQKFYKENTALSNLIILVIIMMIVIIGILINANQRRERLINQDFLTQMPNRLFINAKSQSVIDRREPFGILMMDVDHFKSINDTLGHPIGDELLIEVAKRLKALSSNQLFIARIGGDEFMALLLGKNLQRAEEICKEIHTSICKEYHLSSGPLHITASLGCALYPNHTDDPTKVMSYADAALYEIKERGRNGYQLFHPTLVKHLMKL